MRHLIAAASAYAEERLCKCTRGVIHSVYHRTVNLLAGSQLLSLQAAGSPLSPISLITDLSAGEMESFAAAPGDPVLFSGDEIHILSPGEEVVFLYAPSDLYHLWLCPFSEIGDSVNLKKNISLTLTHSDSGGFLPLFSVCSADASFDSPILTAAKMHMEECLASYGQHCYAAAAGKLIKLIGLGIGLTPSGDDFLCGVLAGLIIQSQTDHPFTLALRQQIALRLKDTNDISAAFLECALDGHFSLAVKRLSPSSSPKEMASSFSSIGHSSGMDTLCGIYYALSL